MGPSPIFVVYNKNICTNLVPSLDQHEKMQAVLMIYEGKLSDILKKHILMLIRMQLRLK